MGVIIREGPDIEIDQLQSLYRYAPWADGRSTAEIEVMLKNTDYVFSAYDDRRLIGFARILTDRVFRGTIWDVVVHPDYQGKGVGEALMNAILSHPVLSNVQKFWLNTRDKQPFYERFGFVRSEQGMFREKPAR